MKGVYIFVVVYIFAAFVWWTYTLIESNKEIHTFKAKMLQKQRRNARRAINQKVFAGDFKSEKALTIIQKKQEVLLDTFLLHEYLEKEFPDFGIRFNPKIVDTITLNRAYNLRVLPSSILTIEQRKTRRMWMFIGEGLVFMLFLVWGFSKILNAYRQKIKLNKQQNNFLLSITHELKSPLASTKLMLQTILKRKLEKPKQNELLDNSLQEINRLNGLVEKLLIAAKIESETYSFPKSKINLTEICQRILERFENIKSHQFEINLTPDVFIKADVFTMELVLNNLIENALKYSHQKSTIKIDLEEKNKQVKFHISDEGPGISEANQKLIFNKFYRIGNEETKSSEGTGLGLFIVRNVLKEHKAKIQVWNNEERGCTFEIEF